MPCTDAIAKNITSDCTTQPVGGLEVEAYLGYRPYISPTYDGTSANKVTALTVTALQKLYKLKGVSKNLNAGHDRVVSDDTADLYKHYFSFKGFEFDSPSVLSLDNLRDLVVFVNYKNKNSTGDGVIVAYGLGTGLYVTSDTRRANDAHGIRSIELSTRDNEEEKYSQYNVVITDYAGTIARLEALLTNA